MILTAALKSRPLVPTTNHDTKVYRICHCTEKGKWREEKEKEKSEDFCLVLFRRILEQVE